LIHQIVLLLAHLSAEANFNIYRESPTGERRIGKERESVETGKMTLTDSRVSEYRAPKCTCMHARVAPADGVQNNVLGNF
jgi:cytochrome c peroxidase